MKKRILAALIALTLLFAMCVGVSADFEAGVGSFADSIAADVEADEAIQPRYREYFRVIETDEDVEFYYYNPVNNDRPVLVICLLEAGDTLYYHKYYRDSDGNGYWWCQLLHCHDSKFSNNDTWGYVSSKYVENVIE